MDETALLEMILRKMRTLADGMIILVALLAVLVLFFACRKG